MTITENKLLILSKLWGHLPRVTRKVVVFNHSYDGPYEERIVCSAIDADIMTSEVQYSSGIHAPVLDLDFQAILIASSTPGHYHLILDKAMTWKTYRRLIISLGKAGILEQGFVRATLGRKYSSIRLPWIKKEELNG